MVGRGGDGGGPAAHEGMALLAYAAAAAYQADRQGPGAVRAAKGRRGGRAAAWGPQQSRDRHAACARHLPLYMAPGGRRWAPAGEQVAAAARWRRGLARWGSGASGEDLERGLHRLRGPQRALPRTSSLAFRMGLSSCPARHPLRRRSALPAAPKTLLGCWAPVQAAPAHHSRSSGRLSPSSVHTSLAAHGGRRGLCQGADRAGRSECRLLVEARHDPAGCPPALALVMCCATHRPGDRHSPHTAGSGRVWCGRLQLLWRPGGRRR